MTSQIGTLVSNELARMDAVHPWMAGIRRSLQGLYLRPDGMEEWLESIGSNMFELAAYRLAATGSDSDFEAFLAKQKPLNVPLMECALGDQPEAHEKLEAFRVAGYKAGYDPDWDNFIDWLEYANR